jgi:hypothetical protein
LLYLSWEVLVVAQLAEKVGFAEGISGAV